MTLMIQAIDSFDAKIMKRKNIFLLLIIILASIPLFRILVHLGHDIDFHLNRILALTDSITTNFQFPHRIASSLLLGYGYASPIYYPELFLYIPAIFNAIANSLFPDCQEIFLIISYQSYILIINIVTTIVCYRCFFKISSSASTALMITSVFVLNPYRWICIYTRAAVGEFTAMSFLPIIVYALYSIYYDNRSIWYINSLVLAIGFSGIIQSHIITSVYTAFFLLVVILILFKHTFTKRVIITFSLAIILVLLLNAWFIVPFVDYTLNFKAKFNYGVSFDGSVQQHGIYLSQLFDFFGKMDGISLVGKNNLKYRFQMSPGIISIFSILTAVYFWIKRRLSNTEKFVLLLTLFAIFMSTVYFPWDFIILLPGIGSVLSSIQFPWRILGFISIFSCVLLCLLISNHFNKNAKKYAFYFIIGITSLFSVWYSVWSFCNMSVTGDVTDLPTSTVRVGGAEYIPAGASTDQHIENASIVSRNGLTTVVSVLDNNASYIDLPIFFYPGYEASTSNGEKLYVTANENKCIRVMLSENCNDLITVSFEEPWLWIFSEILSLCAIILVSVFILKRRKINKCHYHLP